MESHLLRSVVKRPSLRVGNFNPQTVERGDDVVGAARRIDVCGMEFAHVSNDLDCISRGWDDIRRDAQEHLF